MTWFYRVTNITVTNLISIAPLILAASRRGRRVDQGSEIGGQSATVGGTGRWRNDTVGGCENL